MQLCNCVLQRYGVLVMARNVPSASSTRSICVERFMHSLEHMWVAAHAQVVVGAPHRHLVLGRFLVRTRKLLGQTVNVVEVSVRLVLVLLLKLILVEAFVVEIGALGSSRGSKVRRLANSGFEGCVGERSQACAALAC